MHQELITMLEMQNAMNAKVHSDWTSQNFPWYRAIWVECAELMDHYGWKWWKQQTPDHDQVSLELVDIWHFGLSSMIQTTEIVEEIPNTIIQGFTRADTETEFREALEIFAAQTLNTRQFCISEFATLMKSADLSFDELYSSYLGKNVLNFFRQDNGYKEGTYKKIWNGKEDNEHLIEVLSIIDIHQSDAKDLLYKELARRYQLLG